MCSIQLNIGWTLSTEQTQMEFMRWKQRGTVTVLLFLCGECISLVTPPNRQPVMQSFGIVFVIHWSNNYSNNGQMMSNFSKFTKMLFLEEKIMEIKKKMIEYVSMHVIIRTHRNTVDKCTVYPIQFARHFVVFSFVLFMLLVFWVD